MAVMVTVDFVLLVVIDELLPPHPVARATPSRAKASRVRERLVHAMPHSPITSMAAGKIGSNGR